MTHPEAMTKMSELAARIDRVIDRDCPVSDEAISPDERRDMARAIADDLSRDFEIVDGLARHRSAAPVVGEDMRGRARKLICELYDTTFVSPDDPDVEALAAEFNSIRLDTLEDAAKVADKDGINCPDESYEAACQNVASAIRGIAK